MLDLVVPVYLTDLTQIDFFIVKKKKKEENHRNFLPLFKYKYLVRKMKTFKKILKKCYIHIFFKRILSDSCFIFGSRTYNYHTGYRNCTSQFPKLYSNVNKISENK